MRRELGWLFLLMTVVPAVELYLLIQIGRWLGPAPTIAMVILTGIIGASLARREGLRVLSQWREALQVGQMPAEGVLSGVLVLLGGALLIAPGVLTDVVGLLLLFPPTRARIAVALRRALDRRMKRTVAQVHAHRPPGAFRRDDETDAELVEEPGPPARVPGQS